MIDLLRVRGPSLRSAVAGATASIIETRNIFRRPWARQRLDEGINIGDVLVRQHRLRIGWHVTRRVAQQFSKAVERQRRLGKDRRRPPEDAALPGAAVAGETGVSEINLLAVGGIALRADLGRRHGERAGAQSGRGERSEGETRGPDHRQSPSTRIGDYVDDRGLAALDHGDGPRERRSKLVRISYRSLAMDAHAA